MGHIPVSLTKLSSDGKKICELPLPIAGINLNTGRKISGSCRKMNNFVPTDISLRSSGRFEGLERNENLIGTFHGITKRPFCGKMIMHFGTGLYCLEKNGSAWELLYEGVPDEKSMFCEFSSKLYFYGGTYVYGIDRNFNCVEELPEAPVYCENVNNETGTLINKCKDFKFNLLAPRIAISFSAADGVSFKLNLKCDTSRPIKAYNNENEVEVNTAKCTESRVYLKKSTDGNNPVIIEYYLLDPAEISFDDFFAGCEVCESYGGSDVGGTRIFTAGNRQRPGEYCKSEVVNPLHFSEESLEKLGNGSDVITGFLKVYENLLIFTDRSVYKMSYSVMESGGFFSVRQINDSIGCDMPNSIQLIDNRAVFANSDLGVYTVVLTENGGEYNVLPVSGNVNDGDEGLLSRDENELKSAFSVDSGGKYILCSGEKMFVWDYSSCGYTPSYSYEKAQGKLKWYVLKQNCGDRIFELGRRLFSLSESDGVLSKYDENAVTEECEFVTEEYDFDCPTAKKTLFEMILNIATSEGSVMKFDFYGDGELFYSEKVYAKKSGEAFLNVKLPEKSVHRFSYGISAENGFFELKNAALKMSVCAE